jgi:hypothetical protein
LNLPAFDRNTVHGTTFRGKQSLQLLGFLFLVYRHFPRALADLAGLPSGLLLALATAERATLMRNYFFV